MATSSLTLASRPRLATRVSAFSGSALAVINDPRQYTHLCPSRRARTGSAPLSYFVIVSRPTSTRCRGMSLHESLVSYTFSRRVIAIASCAPNITPTSFQLLFGVLTPCPVKILWPLEPHTTGGQFFNLNLNSFYSTYHLSFFAFHLYSSGRSHGSYTCILHLFDYSYCYMLEHTSPRCCRASRPLP